MQEFIEIRTTIFQLEEAQEYVEAISKLVPNSLVTTGVCPTICIHKKDLNLIRTGDMELYALVLEALLAERGLEIE